MKIEHIAIWTTDLERLRTFYETYFEAQSNNKYINERNKFASYFLSFQSGARLELMQMEGVPQSLDDPMAQFTGLIHFAMSVGSKEKVDKLTAVLARDGYQVVGQPRTTGDGYYESVVLDPDGNRIEITI